MAGSKRPNRRQCLRDVTRNLICDGVMNQVASQIRRVEVMSQYNVDEEVSVRVWDSVEEIRNQLIEQLQSGFQ